MTSEAVSLQGKRIIIGLSGGIACFKTAHLVSSLVQLGVTVDVLMTDAAARFITPLTFQSLTGREVFDSQWKHIEGYGPQHIQLATNCDAMLIAPCTMDMIAKLATGLTNDPVSVVCAAIDRTKTPVLLAPSMNATMLGQPATIRNLKILSEDRYSIIQPEDGWQACRAIGRGRMPEPESLLNSLANALP